MDCNVWKSNIIVIVYILHAHRQNNSALGEKIKHIPDELFGNLRGKVAGTASDYAITKNFEENEQCVDTGLYLRFQVICISAHNSQRLEVLDELCITSYQQYYVSKRIHFVQVLK